MYVNDRCQSKALLTSNSVKGATVGHELMWLEIIKKGQTYIVGLLWWTEPSTRRISGSRTVGTSMRGEADSRCTDTAADIIREASIR